MFSANDTLLLDGPVVRGPAAIPTRDRTADLARIVRHALKFGTAASPLDRAIRAAAQMVGPIPDATVEVEGRAQMLAGRLNTLMARRVTTPPANPHRETVRGV
jgi:hypothetical protein